MILKYEHVARPRFAVGEQVEIVPLPSRDDDSCRNFALYGEHGAVTEIIACSGKQVDGIVFRYTVGGNKFIPNNCCWKELELMSVA